jgi:hypothetical protein
VSELDETVKRMLASETFEPSELVEVLVERGHERADVAAAIDRARVDIAAERQHPAELRAARVRRRAGRLIQIGIGIHVVGLGFTLVFGGGLLQLLLIGAAGAAFITAGYRTLRS